MSNVNGPSYMISLGPAEPQRLNNAPETASLSPLQTHPEVSSTAGCCSGCRSLTEKQANQSCKSNTNMVVYNVHENHNVPV